MKPFTAVSVVLLALVALLQLIRFLSGWEIMINGTLIPVWFSGIAFLVVGGLAAMLWRENMHHA